MGEREPGPLALVLPVLTGSSTREEPTEAELAGTMLQFVAPGRHLISICPRCAQCLSSLGEWSVMVAGTPAYNTAPAKPFRF